MAEPIVRRVSMALDENEVADLKLAALTSGMPMSVLVRALVTYGLAHASDPEIAAVVAEASTTEKARRQAAGSVGGVRGAQTKRRTAARQ